MTCRRLENLQNTCDQAVWEAVPEAESAESTVWAPVPERHVLVTAEGPFSSLSHFQRQQQLWRVGAAEERLDGVPRVPFHR